MELRGGLRGRVEPEAGRVAAWIGGPNQLDVLVPLRHVVGELEYLGRAVRGSGSVDQLTEQTLVGVSEGEAAPGDVGDLGDPVDDLRVGQDGGRDPGPGRVVDVVVGLALAVVVDGQRDAS